MTPGEPLFVWHDHEPILLARSTFADDREYHDQQVRCACGNDSFRLFCQAGHYQTTGICTKCGNTQTVHAG